MNNAAITQRRYIKLLQFRSEYAILVQEVKVFRLFGYVPTNDQIAKIGQNLY